ncbi:diguanylate cyclase domain-containing protein [Kineococcus gypseus]|uniref:diguanylate cyclase domain-containing protein n=1 Tax=Kineococcus gypseus TaxID=1637102 RepID=UPI003D7C8B0A
MHSSAASTGAPHPARGCAPLRPELLAQVPDQVGEGVAVFDAADVVVYANAALAALHGCAPSDLLGHHLGAFVDAPEHAVRERAEAEARGEAVVHLELSSRRLHGGRFDAHVTVSPLLGPGGERLGTIVCVRDVTQHRELEARLARAALHDPLTELPNRRLFAERLEQAVARAGRTGGAAAVLFADLDGFKAVNDDLGHAAGDDLLVQVAARFRVCLGGAGTLARLGGDEFAVLLEDVAAPGEALAAAQRVLAALHRPFRLRDARAGARPGAGGEVDAVLSASVGVVLRGTGTGAGLLRAADEAMYRAKRTGRGSVVVVDERPGAAAR